MVRRECSDGSAETYPTHPGLRILTKSKDEQLKTASSRKVFDMLHLTSPCEMNGKAAVTLSDPLLAYPTVPSPP